MKIYLLDDNINTFPNPELANTNGLLALGGDLKSARILNAYANGIFPWYTENDPILWWSPNPRGVLFIDNYKVSRSMKKFLRKNIYTVTFDSDFSKIISLCREIRVKNGTWIDEKIINSYTELYRMGYAHSVETRDLDGNIVGGLYGLSLGRVFFGESMFSLKENSSKVALYYLINKLKKNNFKIIDCQFYTEHLGTLGAVDIPRSEYLQILKDELRFETLLGNWEFL
ncbi:MAG: leucyl/phenylalanyl-tRNA--protein transferase [Fusobacteria bacterium]|jgi:leucyl/phenylalanyl-tRNA--protein transferase|nr:leucyl/phenylalanyl-tRNA--protein transferase [Fusobacteriota bacterium]